MMGLAAMSHKERGEGKSLRLCSRQKFNNVNIKNWFWFFCYHNEKQGYTILCHSFFPAITLFIGEEL